MSQYRVTVEGRYATEQHVVEAREPMLACEIAERKMAAEWGDMPYLAHYFGAKVEPA